MTQNKEMQRTSHGPNGGSPLISVFGGRQGAAMIAGNPWAMVAAIVLAPSPSGHVSFTSAGGFVVVFPGKPSESEVLVHENPVVVLHKVAVVRGQCMFQATYEELPVPLVRPQQLLDGHRNGVLTLKDTRLVSERECSLADCPGREMRFQTRRNPTVQRVYVCPARRMVYQVQVTCEDEQAMAGSQQSTFLDSFRLHP